jgi:hypothetical protein
LTPKKTPFHSIQRKFKRKFQIKFQILANVDPIIVHPCSSSDGTIVTRICLITCVPLLPELRSLGSLCLSCARAPPRAARASSSAAVAARRCVVAQIGSSCVPDHVTNRCNHGTCLSFLSFVFFFFFSKIAIFSLVCLSYGLFGFTSYGLSFAQLCARLCGIISLVQSNPGMLRFLVSCVSWRGRRLERERKIISRSRFTCRKFEVCL